VAAGSAFRRVESGAYCGHPPVRRLLREILVRVMAVCAQVLQLFGASGGAIAAFALVTLALAALLIAAPDGRSSAQP
jgi:hypothetical protein